jgi:hypothetical protein
MKDAYDICPACDTKFKISQNRANTNIFNELLIGQTKSSTEIISDSSLVQCPNCHNAFTSEHIKFFAFLSPKHLHSLLLAFLMGFALLAIYLAATSI